MNTSYKKIFKATTLFGGVQGLNILLNLVRTKLAALILGPAGIGLSSIYNETRELMRTTSNMGLDVSSVREVSQAFEEGDQDRLADAIQLTRSWVLLLALLGTLLCLVLSEPLSWIGFSDFDHTWDFVLLSPSVALAALTCGEMAILKGVRRLKALATISLLNVIAGLATTIPLYYLWGLSGIVPALVLMTLCMYLIIICYSYRTYPLHIDIKGSHLRKGFPMLVVGMSFVLASMVNHGTELAIRAYLNNVASLNVVGLYSAGVTIVMTYGGVIFAALENDYFPRLSGIFSDLEKRNDTMNKQTKVLLTLVVPLIIVMILALPIAVPLLFSSEFCEVIPMTQIASMGLLFKAVYLPAGYMPLAAGDSKSFLGLETTSYLIVLVSVVVGYHFYSIIGGGIALAASNCVDMFVIMAFVRWRYKVSLDKRMMAMTAGACVLLCTVLVLCLKVGSINSLCCI